MRAADRAQILEGWHRLVKERSRRVRSDHALQAWGRTLLEATEACLRGQASALEEAVLSALRSLPAGPIADHLELVLLFRRATLQTLTDLAPAEREALDEAFDRALLVIAAWHDGTRAQPAPTGTAQAATGEIPLLAILPAEVARSTRYGRPLSLLLVKWDAYDAVAALRGLEAADRRMEELHDLLGQTLRASDIRYRIAPDRIAVLLPETGAEEAAVAAERIREQAAATSDGLRVTVGIASCPTHATDPDGLLRCAEEALGVAERMGGDLSLVYRP